MFLNNFYQHIIRKNNGQMCVFETMSKMISEKENTYDGSM